MRDDLKMQLRAFANGCRGSMWQSRNDTIRLCDEAADAIEAQAAEIEELKSWKAAEDAHHHAMRAEIKRLREALGWALAEMNGTTRYDNGEQRENCFALAEKALRADKAGQDAAERLDEAGQATRHIRRDGMTAEQIEALERLIRMIVRDEMDDNYYFDFLRAKEDFTALINEGFGK